MSPIYAKYPGVNLASACLIMQELWQSLAKLTAATEKAYNLCNEAADLFKAMRKDLLTVVPY